MSSRHNRLNAGSRRRFLKTSAVGAACLAAGGLGVKRGFAKTGKTAAVSAWTNGKKINPKIDNLRVAIVTDPAMITKPATRWSAEESNQSLNLPKVYENMDKLAVALARPASGTAADAWAAIFQKPEGKEWRDVTAGIVPNAAFGNAKARLAPMVKIARELVNLQVKGSNITIFDGGNVSHGDAALDYDTAYCRAQLPEGVKISGRPGGSKAMPMPNGKSWKTVGDVADNKFDILVLVPCNKGHEIATFTLAMKMGYGVVKFSHDKGESAVSQAPKLAAIHKSTPMLGSGSVSRLQLIVTDALYSMVGGPMGTPNKVTNTLLMGVFAPAMDQLTVNKVRRDIMKLDNMSQKSLDIFWREFGYDPDSPQIKNLDAVDAAKFKPVALTPSETPAKQPAAKISLALSVPARPARLSFNAAPAAARRRLAIYTFNGRLVRSITIPGRAGNLDLSWDGRGDNGKRARPGMYLFKLHAGGKTLSRKAALL